MLVQKSLRHPSQVQICRVLYTKIKVNVDYTGLELSTKAVELAKEAGINVRQEDLFIHAEANKSKDHEVKKRFYLIKAVAESKKDIKKTCEARGVSTDQFYNWANRFLEAKNLNALKSLSRSAKRFWNKTSLRIEKELLKLEKLSPFWGQRESVNGSKNSST